MKLQKAIGVAAGTVGLTALANRLLTSRAHRLEPPLAGDHRTYRWRGFDVAYTEAGDPDDPDMVLLHGINAAASSHEFQSLFDDLAQEYHVLAPDLPGFGHSDRPPLVYSASLMQTFVRDFIQDLADEPRVVASSLTGAYAAMAAREVPVSDLVLICPTDRTMETRRPWLRTLLRSPVVGEALFNLLVSKPSIRYFHADHGYADPSLLTKDVVEYEWATAHQQGARFAPASFLSGYLDPEEDLADVLRDLAVPVTLVWGRDADVATIDDGRDLADAGDAGLIVFEDSLLLPHVEHPDQFVDVVEGEFERATT